MARKALINGNAKPKHVYLWKKRSSMPPSGERQTLRYSQVPQLHALRRPEISYCCRGAMVTAAWIESNPPSMV
ncbi:hypothetical protein AC578_10107 [Pseudocercospora eumusae]|uniref:Uncharacterized protein n=1 Tax=Pseudocercospora eumusae TaxID=321146 RepID=A0A139GZG6_9PEZI|nr:hypothetical protein AC578_10107 [Pseudocercospora eumusae]